MLMPHSQREATLEILKQIREQQNDSSKKKQPKRK